MKQLFIFLILFGVIGHLAGEATVLNNKGIIEGTVIDRLTLQPIPAVNIMVMGTQWGAVSDEKGKYIIKIIPIGNYRLKASMMGYEESIKTEVAVLTNRATMVNFELNSTVLKFKESVLVTSGYFQRDHEKVISHKSLSSKEIRLSPGSGEDIFRIIQSMPGVGKSGSKNANLIVRGGAPDENLTLLDNIEIVNPLHFARQGVSMGVISIVNPTLLERVDFLTGGFPARYGDKMTSVFEMRLKEGNRTHLNTDVNLNLAGLNITLDGPLSKDGNMILSIRRGYFDVVTSLMNAPVSPRYWDAVGKWTTHLGADHTISVVGFYYRDDVERTGKVPHGEVEEIDKYNLAKRVDLGTAVGANWHYLFSKRGYMLTTVALIGNGWKSKFGNEEKPDLKGEDITENEFHLKSESTYKLSDKVELKGGIFWKTINSDHYTWREAGTTRTGFVFPADTVKFEPPLTHKAGSFVQIGLRPYSRLSVTTGLRFDYFEYTDESKLSPRIGVSFDLSDRFAFNFTYGTFYQTPATYQVALDPVNEKLHSSRADHAIAGIEYQLRDDTQCSIEFYQKKYQNAFVNNDTSEVITNEGSGIARGMELFIQKKMSDNLLGSLAYTYLVSRRKDAGFLSEYDSDYDQRHNLTLTAGYKPNDRWQIGVKFQYATGFPYTPAEGALQKSGQWYIVEGNKNSARYPDFHKLDIRVDRTFRFSNWTLSAYIDLWNVYNRKNVVSYRYTATGNAIEKEAIYDFSFLPIFGLSAQF